MNLTKKDKDDKEITSYFSSFIKEIERQKLSPSTIEDKKRKILLFRDWLVSKEMINLLPEEIEKKEIKNYRNYLKRKNLKESTIISYMRLLYAFFNYIEDCGGSLSFSLSTKEDSDIQKIVNYYFQKKGLSIEEIKEDAKKRKIIYSRFTKPAKDLLYLAGSVDVALDAINKVSLWAKSRNLDYAIETVIKKWPEIKNLKQKEKKDLPYFRNEPMIWSNTKRKWYVISSSTGEWLEFAGEEKDIEWRKEE